MNNYFENNKIEYNQQKSQIENTAFYRVQKGDTLSSICEKLNVKKDFVLSLNNTSENNIEQGDVLLIEKTQNICHIVMPTETVKTIAQKYNISVEELKRKNNTKVLSFHSAEQTIL